MLLLQGREMERKNEKEFYLFADNAYNEEEEPKIYAETGEDGRGLRFGGGRGRTGHEYFREPFFLRRSATQTAAAPCMFHAYRPPVGGRAAGRHSVARGSCVWRQVSRPRGAAGDITIMVLQVRRRAREIPLRFPEGSIAP